MSQNIPDYYIVFQRKAGIIIRLSIFLKGMVTYVKSQFHRTPYTSFNGGY